MLVLKYKFGHNEPVCFIENDSNKQRKILLESFGLYEPCLTRIQSFFNNHKNLIILWSNDDFFISDNAEIVVGSNMVDLQRQVLALNDRLYLVDHVVASDMDGQDITNLYLHEVDDCVPFLSTTINNFHRKNIIDELLTTL